MPDPNVPAVLPAPICKVAPALIVLAPYELVPVKVTVFVPAWVNEPLPLMALLTVVALERLKISVPLSVIAPVPMEPDVPPLPICKVAPELIVVAP